MKLVYRGVTYDYSPSRISNAAPSVAQEVHPAYNLRYRGAVYEVDPNREGRRSVFHGIANLFYRGSVYSLLG
jgi:hypothetical protein